MTQIKIRNKGKEYEVIVTEEDSETKHYVTLSDETYNDLKEANISREELIKSSFEFLLERESKESILKKFDITLISKYFPEYKEEIKNYFLS